MDIEHLRDLVANNVMGRCMLEALRMKILFQIKMAKEDDKAKLEQILSEVEGKLRK